MPTIDLRRLIVLLALCTSLATLLYTLLATYNAERVVLIENTLESNRAYAAKLANSTDEFLNTMQQQLAYSAELLSTQMQHTVVRDAEAKRLQQQNKSFNSVIIVDSHGKVMATSPPDLGLSGKLLDSVGAQQALALRQPLISPPYVSQTNRLIIFLSNPIFSPSGRYLGYVGGSIYLHESNSLNILLGEHYYRDGSQIYVVDHSRRLIYHQDSSRVGEYIANNLAIEDVVKGKDGEVRLVNSQNVPMLAGYAATKKVHWGIVVQRPTKIVLNDLHALLRKSVGYILPFYLLTAVLIWWLGSNIARPLKQLARLSPNLDSPDSATKLKNVRTWYYEATQIKRALIIGLQRLSKKIGRMDLERNTDPLTRLLNRRGMDSALIEWQQQGKSFSVLACDIDRFKRVNDTYGHAVGDLVLQFLADTMRQHTRNQDLLCRAGGEEFFIFLADQNLEEAWPIAERLRQAVEQSESPSGSHITISIGVSHWPSYSENLASVMQAADQALYAAKNSGRNCTIMAQKKDDLLS